MTRLLRRSAALAVLLAALAIVPVPGARAAVSTTYDFEACDQGWKPTAATTGHHTWMRTPGGDGGSRWSYGYPLYDGDVLYSITSPHQTWGGGKVTITYAARWQYEHPATGIDTAKLEWTADKAEKTKDWKRLQVFGDVANKDFPNYTKFKHEFEVPKGSFRLRYTMTGDAFVQGLGFFVDNIVVPVAPPKGSTCA